MVYSTVLSTRFGATYGSGAYDSGDYNGTNTTTTAAGASTDGSGTGGLLANTGFDILLAISFACLIIFAALVIRFWRRPKQSAAAAVAATPASGAPASQSSVGL